MPPAPVPTWCASRCGGRRDPLGHGCGPAPLRRLPDLHRGVQARQFHPARRAVAARARHGGGRIPRCAARVRSGRLHALRGSALHARLPVDRDPPARRRHRHHRLRSVHRLRLLRGGLPVPGALQDRSTRASPTARRCLPSNRASIRAGSASRPNAPSAPTASTRAWRKASFPGSIRTRRRPASIPASPRRCTSATRRTRESNISQLLAENQHFRMHEELGTEPGFYYLWDKRR